MQYNFDTDRLDRAQAALLLYGLYRSRDKNSSLNGLETWERFNSYVRGACLKSNTTAEFVQNFCLKAGITSIKPTYFGGDEPVKMPGGYLVDSPDIKNYRLAIFENNDLLKVLSNETMYLIMLVRERIQRERFEDEGDQD